MSINPKLSTTPVQQNCITAQVEPMDKVCAKNNTARKYYSSPRMIRLELLGIESGAASRMLEATSGRPLGS